jgi:two-component system, sensor histidine kinase
VRDAGRIFLGALRTRYENVALVSELRIEQAEAQAARVKAETADRAKTHFLAAASHDLRQPLTALALFNRLLNDSARDPETRRIAGHIDASVNSLESLMAALLDISKLDAGTVQPILGVVSLEELFARLEAQYAPQAAQKNLTFEARAAGAWVKSDAMLLERIVRNLIENALRYTREGSIKVTARAAGASVVVEVTDTGIGIAPKEQEKIFEEFYQIRNSERDAKQGLGLGLAIVQRTAQLLGCPIEVISKLNVGSNFRVRVPRADAPPLVTDESLAMRPIETPDLTGLKILVVDDDESILVAMCALLESWGCEVRTAESLSSAEVEMTAMGERPDLLLVDFRLRNGETGTEVVREANARFGRVPAILITGDTAPDRLREAAESGLGLIHKPVRPEQLREQIERVLELRPE